MPPRLGPDGKIQAADITTVDAVPTAAPLPSLADMLGLDRADLLDLLRRFGITDDPLDLRADTIAYLSRMTRLGVDTDAFAQELERLLDQETRRGLLGLVRRTQERYTTAMSVGGNPEQLLIRISEGDSHTCNDCYDLAGAIGTFAEHEAIGLPGAQTCLGGDYCRCQLVPTRYE